jgi:hypothetical protein
MIFRIAIWIVVMASGAALAEPLKSPVRAAMAIFDCEQGDDEA